MTDSEIIKALECWATNTPCEESCECFKYDTPRCDMLTAQNALNLINRQKAEIERLQSRNNFLEIEYKNQSNLFWSRVDGAKTDAIREFAERLIPLHKMLCLDEGDWRFEVDNILNEMGVKK